MNIRNFIEVLVAVTIWLVIAATANWVVIRFLDVDSSDRIVHGFIGTTFLMGYLSFQAFEVSLGQRIWLFLIAAIPCYIGTALPDWDIKMLGIGNHRNPVFHSCLPIILVSWLVGRGKGIFDTVILGFSLGLGSHLFWDIIDYGDVRWLKGAILDRVWLGINGLICLVVAALTDDRFSETSSSYKFFR